VSQSNVLAPRRHRKERRHGLATFKNVLVLLPGAIQFLKETVLVTELGRQAIRQGVNVETLQDRGTVAVRRRPRLFVASAAASSSTTARATAATAASTASSTTTAATIGSVAARVKLLFALGGALLVTALEVIEGLGGVANVAAEQHFAVVGFRTRLMLLLLIIVVATRVAVVVVISDERWWDDDCYNVETSE